MLSDGVIMDYEVIVRHLLNNSTNPFNREHLTLEILEEYNKKPEIVKKIEEFKIKLNKFKNSLMKKNSNSI